MESTNLYCRQESGRCERARNTYIVNSIIKGNYVVGGIFGVSANYQGIVGNTQVYLIILELHQLLKCNFRVKQDS